MCQFTMFALVLEFGARTRHHDLWPFLISKTRLKFPSEPKAAGKRASPVNQAHVKMSEGATTTINL